VSLASAKAAYLKLETFTGGITEVALLNMTDEQFRECYFSRQKTIYARALASALLNGELRLAELPFLPDDEVRRLLCAVKGIGNWTTDVYLLFILHRTDVFPTGDLAMVNAMKQVFDLPKTTTTETLVEQAEAWRPFRSIATMLFWQHYLGVRKKKS
jgi:DNA-3-methyladenine glycosylase II